MNSIWFATILLLTLQASRVGFRGSTAYFACMHAYAGRIDNYVC